MGPAVPNLNRIAQARSVELLDQLSPEIGLSPFELAETAQRTLRSPAVSELRAQIVPEHRSTRDLATLPLSPGGPTPSYDRGVPDVVFDWKSDIT